MFDIDDIDIKNVKQIAMPGGSLMELGIYLKYASMMFPSLFGLPFYAGICNLFGYNHFGCYCSVGFDNQVLCVHMGNYSSVGHSCRFGLGCFY